MQLCRVGLDLRAARPAARDHGVDRARRAVLERLAAAAGELRGEQRGSRRTGYGRRGRRRAARAPPPVPSSRRRPRLTRCVWWAKADAGGVSGRGLRPPSGSMLERAWATLVCPPGSRRAPRSSRAPRRGRRRRGSARAPPPPARAAPRRRGPARPAPRPPRARSAAARRRVPPPSARTPRRGAASGSRRAAPRRPARRPPRRASPRTLGSSGNGSRAALEEPAAREEVDVHQPAGAGLERGDAVVAARALVDHALAQRRRARARAASDAGSTRARTARSRSAAWLDRARDRARAQHREVLPGGGIARLIALVAVERRHEHALLTRWPQPRVDLVGHARARHRREIGDQPLAEARRAVDLPASPPYRKIRSRSE